MITKQSKFKILSIDQDKGEAVVCFINKNGPIETGIKTIDDFKRTYEIASGNYYSNGSPIMTTMEAYEDNPNEDLIYNIIIPMTSNTEFMSATDFKSYVAKTYPHEEFEEIEKRKINNIPIEYNNLVDIEENITVNYSTSDDLVQLAEIII
jgi:hypothetical protein